MRRLGLAICILAIVLPFGVSAQVGPCGSGDTCASGQVCIGPSGSGLCYRTCNPAAASGATDACPASETCGRPTGISQDVCSLSTPSTSIPADGSPEVEEAPFTPVTPVLGVPIPGGSLSAPTREGGTVRVAFLAEYINAVYRYLSGIILVVAIVMCVYGGFLYLGASAGVGEIARGKRIIIDSVMGMLIVLSAYGILNLVNPATINLKVLELESVDRIDAALNVTREATIDESETGTFITSGECPVTLSAPIDLNNARGTRTTEFITGMQSRLTGNTRQDVLTVANAIVACNIHAGSCGRTVETVNEVIGVSGRGRRRQSISNDQMLFLDTIKCASGTGSACTRPAKAQAYERLRSEISGYPDSWTDELQPGDAITVFNANSGPFGTHAAIFMGWASGGRANVVQGMWGREARTGTICIKSECGAITPLVRTFHP
jgi:hypothetical protein